ncbi:hypothetical protein KI809_16855 [Geobacter pelophilus]|jgi:hypothetical protein|uniref:Cytosolic protein n=1 Tax=Geoanaerobacter pelophilus TaxID=60036 RepID=A0AAW4L518_9BACT|nr:DUF6485 family protein [Geoanaerobacter pelophilus]MBT0665983.1 hypothetical protein [Geoanaerobacter pelophilus]
MECVATTSKAHCSCSYSACDKRGNCCKCVEYHLKNGEIPGCFFTPAGEKSYDRSIRNFISDRSGQATG